MTTQESTREMAITTKEPTRKLTLHRETLKNLKVRTGIRAGVGTRSCLTYEC